VRSRKLTKRIEIWQTTPAKDGFGGNTVTDVLVSKSWADVSTFQAGKYRGGNLSDFGIIEAYRAVLFKVRKRNDLTYDLKSMYIKYRDVKYTIASAPTNVNFNDKEIVFLGISETKKV